MRRNIIINQGILLDLMIKNCWRKKFFTVDGGMVENVKNHFNEIIEVVSTELVM